MPLLLKLSVLVLSASRLDVLSDPEPFLSSDPIDLFGPLALCIQPAPVRPSLDEHTRGFSLP